MMNIGSTMLDDETEEEKKKAKGIVGILIFIFLVSLAIGLIME